MPPVTTASVILLCPDDTGHGRQFTILDLLDFNDQHNPVGSPVVTFTNNQTSLIEVIPDPNGTGNPLEFKIRTKAPKPANISSAVVTFDDHRVKPDGNPVPDVIVTITLVAQPSLASFEADPAHLPLTAQTEADGAP